MTASGPAGDPRRVFSSNLANCPHAGGSVLDGRVWCFSGAAVRHSSRRRLPSPLHLAAWIVVERRFSRAWPAGVFGAFGSHRPRQQSCHG